MAKKTKPERLPLLAGNWKLNLDHFEAIATVQKLAWALDDAKFDYEAGEIAVLPPFTDIRSVQTLIAGDKLSLSYGAQDLSVHDSGAFTGEVSGRFLKRLGCRYAIVGHSERRAYHQETDSVVQEKVAACLRHELLPILCVGEPLEVREAGEHEAHTLAQLSAALEGLTAEALAGLVVAYEPVWAIGTGRTATAEDAATMATAIRGRLEELYDPSFAAGVRILYGGSVKAENVAAIMASADVDGALVGGASLSAADFSALAVAAQRG
ncbi:triose-phosphate isomerase [Brevibacterium sp. 50QC2O2]|uniref:triose-phosphate isomerase n=1 Tax=Brevibacterium TaxID=1696 RepID=UPI00211C84F7|nr:MULTISPECIES: triose-phosphate isomerase [unclassified Brevibacterium]MCQ9366829.1 triose-phosphate isomerase [Brevibacterium sp. 91QC2O2]MCQ9383979.1 triose-phosphate isomerase [Brevibacterium sp. 68QC2CO]MCQ9389167.1 triose-phosphate isomerase [Brevibacterium sp. 50QC2O2]